ncbi:SGNH/GDSL hydrolase family protein [Xanthobacter sp. KR7-65]|uniref:SGNH/GDSL hydrolase family protein n=1 Tax=Xanthobacter sp. KR7-65 TaxID=3156612 RepID=UPI0032B4B038
MIPSTANLPSARAWERLAGLVPRRLRVLLAVLLTAGLVALGIGQLPQRTRVAFAAEVGARLASSPVLAIGDSIAYQAAPRTLCGEEVLNAAVPGDRISDLLERAPALAAHLKPARVVVAVGVNDSALPHPSIADWKASYRALLGALAGAELVLVEINPVDASRSPYVERLDAGFIAEQNAAIRELAAETGAVVVPAPRAAATNDGLHPTRAGAVLWRARLSAAACR